MGRACVFEAEQQQIYFVQLSGSISISSTVDSFISQPNRTSVAYKEKKLKIVALVEWRIFSHFIR